MAAVLSDTVNPPDGDASSFDRGVAEVTAALVQVARERRTVTYGELAARVLDGRLPARSSYLMRLLGAACEELDSPAGVMHAALVVRSDSGVPGDGFFLWLERSGPIDGDRRDVWSREVERVWALHEDDA